jgi:hypothetical protein
MPIFVPDFLGNLIKLIERSSCKHHIRAFLGESKRDAAADTSSGTRYEGDFVFELHGKPPGSKGPFFTPFAGKPRPAVESSTFSTKQ